MPLRVFLYLLALVTVGAAAGRFRRLVKPFIKNNNKFFMRLTLKNNVFPPAILFAYGAGFRMNWDMALPTSRAMKDLVKVSLDSNGFNGDECLRRAICEVSRAPKSDQNVIGKLLDLFFMDKESKASSFCRRDLKESCPISLPSLSADLLEQALTPS